jgi:hypothetical protein
MRNVSDKSSRENKTRILFSISFFPENRGVYEIMWKKNMAEPERPQMTIQYGACALRAE